MPRDEELLFADHMGRFYAGHHGFPPMAGRLLGYLLICDPPQQTIDTLGDALLASRSAITGAVKLLEGYGYVARTRRAGERFDRVGLRPEALEPRNAQAELFKEQAALLREGLAILPETQTAQRAALLELVALAEFFQVRLPQLMDEWREHRAALRAEGKLPELE
ncbi:MarR family transcriptional regulator [Dactylosporangium sp. AC04546]|uniref:GbsR/MarR family transcriptional regulator n=1 Tax=Dactylosporangium sp. AC04546 TaxID=2862460 RepID=UPI001EDF0A23|nr:MarR family transcriptional regulator [Dactylosporangium sp. AC04546]WVK88433.1 MarR family transcriptional regulator [Dactylosporangium sp. AC04546]